LSVRQKLNHVSSIHFIQLRRFARAFKGVPMYGCMAITSLSFI